MARTIRVYRHRAVPQNRKTAEWKLLFAERVAIGECDAIDHALPCAKDPFRKVLRIARQCRNPSTNSRSNETALIQRIVWMLRADTGKEQPGIVRRGPQK
jgi:hypothetical protein